MALVRANIKAVNNQHPTNPPKSQQTNNYAASTSGHPGTTTQNPNVDTRNSTNTASAPSHNMPSALQDAPDALFSDIIQINAPQCPRQGLNYVSPLEAIAPNNAQVFSTRWGQSARNPQARQKRSRRGQGRRGIPYQRENLAPTRPPLLMEMASTNQNYQAAQQSAPQGNHRRRGARTNNPMESH